MRLWLVGVWVLVLCAAGGCAGADYMLVGSALAPNANGEVEVEKADDGQWLVTVLLDSVAPPERMGEGLTTYVLWLGPVGEVPANKGAVQYDAKTRGVRAMGTTAPALVELTITAEASADVATPSDIVIASRKIAED